MRVEDLTGQTFGTLTVLSRDPVNTRAGKARWLCMCTCGRAHTSIGNSLKYGRVASCGAKVHRACVRRDDICYGAAHQRVIATRGSATAYACVDCGGQAKDWSYTHADPDELVSDYPATLGYAYSVDPAFYAPRCRRCHAIFDDVRGGHA